MSKEHNTEDKDKALDIDRANKRFYLTKDRQGNYQILNELAYEKKLIYG